MRSNDPDTGTFRVMGIYEYVPSRGHDDGWDTKHGAYALNSTIRPQPRAISLAASRLLRTDLERFDGD